MARTFVTPREAGAWQPLEQAITRRTRFLHRFFTLPAERAQEHSAATSGLRVPLTRAAGVDESLALPGVRLRISLAGGLVRRDHRIARGRRKATPSGRSGTWFSASALPSASGLLTRRAAAKFSS
jgi:hypothetical protein